MIKPQSPVLHDAAVTDMVKLPYFDYLLKLLNDGNDVIASSFGRHVHWGYWQQPELAELTTADFEQAAENLSRQVCLSANIQNGLSVLDVGCGFGGTVAHINEHFTNMGLVGLNLDERQLVRARERVLPTAENDIQFQQGDACSLPFADQSFDVVLAVECIFHFPDRERFFQEAHRILKPGGYLALSDFVPKAAVLPLTNIKLPDRYSIGFYGKNNVFCSAKHYRKLAERTRFTLLVKHDITRNTLPTYSYLRQLAKLQRGAGKMAMLETVLLEILSRVNLVNYYILAFQKQI